MRRREEQARRGGGGKAAAPLQPGQELLRGALRNVRFARCVNDVAHATAARRSCTRAALLDG
jgi:hypothetical protein